MSNSVIVGTYQLTLESRGIWISRVGDDGPSNVRPFLSFSLTESGKGPVVFSLQRLYQSSANIADIHGFTTDRVALDARVRLASNGEGLVVDFRVGNDTEEMNVRVAAHITLSGEADPRWMVPGFFYGNNKPNGVQRMYPAYSETNRDPRRLMSNFWAFRSDRTALPMVCVWTYGAFCYMLTDNVFGRTKDNMRGVGMSGLSFGTVDGHPAMSVEFPYREAPVKFSFCQEDRLDPEEIFILLPESVPLIASFQIGLEKPELHAYDPVIRGFYRERGAINPTRAKMPPEWAEHSAHSGLLRWHYDGRNAAIYEAVNFDRALGKKPGPGERSHMHAGWQSGFLPAYALLWAGRETKHMESITAGTAVFNKFCAQLSPAGTIFPVWTEEHGWSCSIGPEDGTAHSRTVAEAVLFLLRGIALEIGYNSNHPQWVDAALSSLNYAVGAQREDGCFPTYYDLATGSPKHFEGCGGLPWLAAMAAGAALIQKPHYRDVAMRAGNYYAQFLTAELIHGCIEDQHLVPTCEDCHWAVIAYILLYELDRDARWLTLARQAADLAMTWRMTYNVIFTPESMLGRYDFRTRGGDICSVATPMLSCYGLVSYRELLKLAAYTGDDYYLERAEDARAFATQMIAREEGVLNARAGMVCSHVYHTDWVQPKGLVHNQSHAMMAASIKYAELTRRNLNISRITYEAARNGLLEEELRVPAVLYSDVALSDEVSATDSMPIGANAMNSRSGVIRKPPELQAGGGFGSNFEDMPLKPGQDLLSGLSNSLGIKGGRPGVVAGPPTPAARPGPGGRPATQGGGGADPRSPHTSGVRPRPNFTPLPPDSRPTTQAAEVSRMMTNTLSSALGLSSNTPAPPRQQGGAPPPSSTQNPTQGTPRPGGFNAGTTPPPRGAENPYGQQFHEPGPAGQQPSPPRPGSGEVEIKYKIF